MRIVHEYNLGHKKVTFFRHEGKLSIKVESGLMSYTMKLGEIEMNKLEEIIEVMKTEEFLKHDHSIEKLISMNKSILLNSIVEGTDDFFDEII